MMVGLRRGAAAQDQAGSSSSALSALSWCNRGSPGLPAGGSRRAAGAIRHNHRADRCLADRRGQRGLDRATTRTGGRRLDGHGGSHLLSFRVVIPHHHGGQLCRTTCGALRPCTCLRRPACCGAARLLIVGCGDVPAPAWPGARQGAGAWSQLDLGCPHAGTARWASGRSSAIWMSPPRCAGWARWRRGQAPPPDTARTPPATCTCRR